MTASTPHFGGVRKLKIPVAKGRKNVGMIISHFLFQMTFK